MRLNLDESLGITQGAERVSMIEPSFTLEDLGVGETGLEWENEAEMQRILELLPSAVASLDNGGTTSIEFSSLSDLDLGWELADLNNPSSLVGIGAS
jgi:hypothetical protein